jgi:GNAT superfamily N-acetyltransferase
MKQTGTTAGTGATGAVCRRVVRLRVHEGREPQVGGAAHGMEQFLAEPNDAAMVARLGDELVVGARWLGAARVDVVRGTTFRHTGSEVTGWRYLYRSPDAKDRGRVIGALNITHHKRGSKPTAVVSNIFVADDHRRKGIATRLVSLAVDDYPGLVVDAAMTELGGRFFGYEPVTAAESAADRPRRGLKP